MIKTDDVVVLDLMVNRYITLVTQGQMEEYDHEIRVLDPEEPGNTLLVTLDDVELLTQELAEEILGV